MTENAITESQEMELEAPDLVFMAPSIRRREVLAGHSYTYESDLPKVLVDDMTTECVLGVDEAGRGPVLGPMVYGLFYLPLSLHHTLLRETHQFDDSKAITASFRTSLMEKLCTPDSDLYTSCGWATRVMSARDISAGMMRASGTYNLNAQAMDATVDLINGVIARGVNVKEVYIDTIGKPEIYQRKLEKLFPTTNVTVAAKADALYPSVSAASVCAKVTRDAALDVCYEAYAERMGDAPLQSWGSGYPDPKCQSWMRNNMDPFFGWGSECRFSWSTAKDMLEGKNGGVKVEWPVEEEDDGMKMTDFMMAADEQEGNELADWYGKRVTEEVF